MPEKQLLLEHGSGGQLTSELIHTLFLKHFGNNILNKQYDASILYMPGKTIAYTTDSYVVDPIFFPGGNIGKLAVCGTVNDLAVTGATPLYLSAGFIIEEGFLLNDLEKIVTSMADEAHKAGIIIVTGDTKVVNKGKCDKLFINTSGIGSLPEKNKHIASGKKIKPGDKIIVNGYLGDHGISVMAERESLKFSTTVKSDCTSLNALLEPITNKYLVRFMRDATRGGVATVLAEMAGKLNTGIDLEETTIPVRESVKGLCELFGFDPLYVANEGKVIMVVDAKDAEIIVSEIKQKKEFNAAAIIGTITEEHKGKVVMNTSVGGRRIVDMLAGEQLPRIC
jgi:hydrogenase expression/formation protein HypE